MIKYGKIYNEPGLVAFLKWKAKYPNGALHVDVKSKSHRIISLLDFKTLKNKVMESDYLQNVKSLQYLLKNYNKIIGNYYKTFNRPYEKNTAKPFANTRKYTSIDDPKDIEL